jgi:hypothetical protein
LYCTVLNIFFYFLQSQASTLPVQRGFSTLPRKPPVGGLALPSPPPAHNNSVSPRTPLQHPPPPPRRDPNTTLSVGRARARSMVASLALETALDSAIQGRQQATAAATGATNGPDGGEQGGGAVVRNLAQELELIFKRDTGTVPTYGTSVADP